MGQVVRFNAERRVTKAIVELQNEDEEYLMEYGMSVLEGIPGLELMTVSLDMREFDRNQMVKTFVCRKGDSKIKVDLIFVDREGGRVTFNVGVIERIENVLSMPIERNFDTIGELREFLRWVV